MLVNHNIIEELLDDAGHSRAEKAKQYARERKVRIMKTIYDDENNFEIKGKAYGNDIYDTYIEVENGEIQSIECTCPDYYNTYGVCKHSLATILAFKDLETEEMLHKRATQSELKKQNEKKTWVTKLCRAMCL